MLTINNNSNYIRKELTAELLRAFFQDKLPDEIDRLPIRLNPRTEQSMRCCIYKDRAMTRYRIMALLGIRIETGDDEYKPLSGFLQEALERENTDGPPLTVLPGACSSCEKTAYKVTDNCRGCLARPCITNCPFNAVEIIGGRAVINKEACRNCGKCKDECPFNAIIRTSVPCEDNCPAGAVTRGPGGQMRIDSEKCISCGRCTRSCPFGAVMERSHIIDVAEVLRNGTPAAAMIAPSVIGQFPGSLGQLISALRTAGFETVLDVASGAEKTAELEAIEFSRLAEHGKKLLATSCCPSWVNAAQKHIPEITEYLSETRTPLYYTSEEAEKLSPGAVKVFIGPCTAKKAEALRDGSADYVLSFEELGALLIARSIDVNDCADSHFDNPEGEFPAKAFAASGGVAAAVERKMTAEAKRRLKLLTVNGLSKKNINLLKAAAAGKLDCSMIEVMSCEGGCICGPGVISNPKVARKKLDEYSRDSA